jgi:hypothetical protein
VREFGTQHLDGDRAIVPQIGGAKNDGHAAGADLVLYAVRVAHRALKRGPEISHAGGAGRVACPQNCGWWLSGATVSA